MCLNEIRNESDNFLMRFVRRCIIGLGFSSDFAFEIFLMVEINSLEFLLLNFITN